MRLTDNAVRLSNVYHKRSWLFDRRSQMLPLFWRNKEKRGCKCRNQFANRQSDDIRSARASAPAPMTNNSPPCFIILFLLFLHLLPQLLHLCSAPAPLRSPAMSLCSPVSCHTLHRTHVPRNLPTCCLQRHTGVTASQPCLRFSPENE